MLTPTMLVTNYSQMTNILFKSSISTDNHQ